MKCSHQKKVKWPSIHFWLFDLSYNRELEGSLLESLPFGDQCDHYEGESTLIQALYNDQIKKYCKPQERKPSTELAQLQNNLSVRVNYAQRLMNGCDYKECLSTLQKYSLIHWILESFYVETSKELIYFEKLTRNSSRLLDPINCYESVFELIA